MRSKRRSPLEGHRDRDYPCVAGFAVLLHFEALIREYYRDRGQMDTESGQSLESGRQCRLTSDAAPSGLHVVDWGLQSDHRHNMHSPDMVPFFGSRGADRSAKLSTGTQTPLLRPVKLQQPNQQKASDYDVSCLVDACLVGGIGVKLVAENSLPGCTAWKRKGVAHGA